MPSASELEFLKSKLQPATTVVRPHPCIASGVQQFGHHCLGNAEANVEKQETEEDTAAAARAAAELLRSASRVAIHTGAGIATAAGIGDFRGANGVWTQLSKGIIPDDSFDITTCVPSFSHMAVKALVDAGIVHDVISTNHDGLHMKSGLVVGGNLHELHGNVYVERCTRCYSDSISSFPILRTTDRYTGRNCECGGRLWDSGIDFGQTLPQHHLHAAQNAAKIADVHLVLGSSLQVAPSSLLPRQYGGKLILVTRSDTPVDKSPGGNLHVRSYGSIDMFMKMLTEALDVHVSRAPTLQEAGIVSITMLLKRRWALRELCVAKVRSGEHKEIDSSLPDGWSHHVDVENNGIDYWFHSPSNQISFGRPCDEQVLSLPESGSLEARAQNAERAFAAAAPTLSEARAKIAARFSKGQGKALGSPSCKLSPPPGKAKGHTSSNACDITSALATTSLAGDERLIWKGSGKGKHCPPPPPKIKGKGKSKTT